MSNPFQMILRSWMVRSIHGRAVYYVQKRSFKFLMTLSGGYGGYVLVIENKTVCLMLKSLGPTFVCLCVHKTNLNTMTVPLLSSFFAFSPLQLCFHTGTCGSDTAARREAPLSATTATTGCALHCPWRESATQTMSTMWSSTMSILTVPSAEVRALSSLSYI